MLDSQLARIVNQIKAELNNYDNEINKLLASTYPTTTCTKLLGELRERINKYRGRLQSIIDDYDPDNSRETREKLITKIHNPLISQEIKFLDWIRNAQTA